MWGECGDRRDVPDIPQVYVISTPGGSSVLLTVRDGGCCVYCGKEVLKEFGLAFCGDHLLPKSLYPDLAQNVDNLVPACAECNLIKHYYDPSEGKGMEIVITEDVRLGFIRKAREEIRRKRIDYERDFLQTGKAPFEQAVALYRKCKATATA